MIMVTRSVALNNRFDEQDRAAAQFADTSLLTASQSPRFDEQDCLAITLERESRPNQKLRPAFDEQDKAAILLRKDAPISSDPSSERREDQFMSEFQADALLSSAPAAFREQDEYASQFGATNVLNADTADTTLLKDGTISLKIAEPEKSKYYIYHSKLRRHFVLSPERDLTLEKVFPSWKVIRQKRREEKRRQKARDAGEEVGDDYGCDGYFVHKPLLGLHHPPRSLRRGPHKYGTPICLFHNSAFWHRWKLLFGDALSNGDVIDHRGVVAYQHHKPRRERGELGFRGYKVRKWRMVGESGKSFVRNESVRRKQPRLATDDSNLLNREFNKYQLGERATADEAVYLDWTSPLSREPRRYHFRYADMDFYWKGTGTVRETKRCGMFLRFNHLKLVARVPFDDGAKEPYWLTRTESKIKQKKGRSMVREICFAKYSSSIATKKAGTLELYDEAIYGFVQDYVTQVKGGGRVELGQEVETVKRTRLYDVFVATAMCMIIGEWQKRETIRRIIEGASAEGGSGGH